jgi:hypothetical protein
VFFQCGFVGWVICEVVHFAGVVLEVGELFGILAGVVEAVLIAVGSDHSSVLALDDNVVPPVGSGLAFGQRAKALAGQSLRGLDISVIAEGGQQVEAVGDQVRRVDPAFGDDVFVAHYEGDADGLFVQYALVLQLMGRVACHTGQMVTWNQIMKSRFEFCDHLDDLDYDSTPPVLADKDGWFPVPIGGQWEEI